jgi:putative membrane protein
MRRHLSLGAGLAVLGAAWPGPLPQLASSPFASHMIVHIAVVAVAAPLIGAWLATDSRLMARLPRSAFSPIPASVVEFIVVWMWHLPILHELARLSDRVWLTEQASFLLAGVLLWTSALRPGPAAEGGSGAGVLALLMTSMHMVLLGTLLTLAPRPLYPHAIQSLGDVYAHLAGQRIGGMLMLIGGGLPYLAGGLYLVNRLLRQPPPDGEVAPARPGTDAR